MQQVNLFQEQFRERPKPLGLGTQVIVLLSVLGLLALITELTGRDTVHSVARVQQLDAQQRKLTEELTALSASIAGRQESVALAAEVQGLREQLRGKTALVTKLETLLAERSVGFSAQLAGLARQRVDGLWFTGVDLGQSGQVIGLYGTTLKPDNVAHFVDQLKREPAFSGAHFNVLKVSRQESNPQWFDFALLTRLTEE